MKIILIISLFLSLISNNLIYSQNYIIKFSLDNTDCKFNSEIKQKSIYKENILIDSDHIKDCQNYLTIPKYNGEYKLKIEISNFDTYELFFQINNSNIDTINLGNIHLINSLKIKNLQEVTLTGIKRKYISIDPEKTTISIAENDFLSNSSLYSTISKLPGVFISSEGDILLGNKNLSLLFDGIPCILSGRDLVVFLQSIPASTAEKIEIISSPGASYDARNGGGILNIITLHRNFKWFSGSINLNYGRSKYDKVSPSISLNGKMNKISWQIQTGVNDITSSSKDNQRREFIYFKPSINSYSNNFGTNQSKAFYIRPNASIKFKKSFFSTNYSVYNQIFTSSTGTNIITENLFNYINTSNSRNIISNQELSLLYKLKLDTLGKTFEISAYHNNSNAENNLQNIQTENILNTYSISNYNQIIKNNYLKYDFNLPSSIKKRNIKFGSKINHLQVNSIGKYNTNNLTSSILTDKVYNVVLPFDYSETNISNYLQFSKKIKKFSIYAGLRHEFFQQNRKTINSNYSFQNSFQNIFPNFIIMHQPNSIMYTKLSYNRSINIPAYNTLDPNNSSNFDKYTNDIGNPLLKPNLTDNYEINYSVFDYLSLTANLSHSKQINMIVYNTSDSSIISNQSYKVYNNVNTVAYSATIPIPFGMFKEGISYFNKNISIDEISYLYLIASLKKTTIENYNNNINSIFTFTSYSQIILPKKIKMTVNYVYQGKGLYKIYQITKPIQYLNINLSKSFLNKSLHLTLSVNDLFNTNELNFLAQSSNLNYFANRKSDTRSFWLTISYSFGMLNKFQKDKTEIDVEKKEIKSDKKIAP